MRVIARGYRSRPYVREIVRDEGKVLILANKDCDDAVRKTLADGVGFPRNHVFNFDSALSQSLMSAWESGNAERLDRLWAAAKPYTLEHASRG